MSAVTVHDPRSRQARVLTSVRPTAATRIPYAAPRLLLPPVPTATSPRPEDVVLLAPDSRSVVRAPTEASWPVASPTPVTSGPLPDPTQLCGAVALAAVEALAGARPLAQLARWVTPNVLDQLETRYRHLAPARARRAATASRQAKDRGCPIPRALVRSARISRVSATVAEGTVVLYDGERIRAAAVRLEVRRQTWRVSVLQIA